MSYSLLLHLDLIWKWTEDELSWNSGYSCRAALFVVWVQGKHLVVACECHYACHLYITFTPRKLFMPLFVVLCLVFALIGGILATYTDSTIPWWDSFTTALSIIAMWMLAHKYVEQWLVWLVVDVISCGLYLYKDLYFTSFLYGLYAVIAFGGYLRWKQLMNVTEWKNINYRNK